MKYSSFLAYFAAIGIVAASSSCSVMNNLTKKPDMTAATSSTTKTDRKKTPSKHATTVDMKSVVEGEWQIVKVGSKTIPAADEMPYVHFSTESNSFYASNGCNILNGSFSITGDQLEISGVLSTMRACEDAPFADAITAVLSDGKSYVLTENVSDGVSYLNLNNDQQHTVMKLRKSDMSFLNGLWQIVKIGSRSYDNPEMNVFFDIPGGKVHGNTGCNFFNGDIYQDVAAAKSISFGNMGTTRMACPDNAAETAMLVALEQVTNARQGQGHTALLYDSQGNILLTLKYIKSTPEE